MKYGHDALEDERLVALDVQDRSERACQCGVRGIGCFAEYEWYCRECSVRSGTSRRSCDRGTAEHNADEPQPYYGCCYLLIPLTT